jgi:shikimate dehydrogenase
MRLFGLIGYPLVHSFSKKYFTEKFERENITDCRFENFPIASITELEKVLLEPSLKGLAVTIPYKEQVIPYLKNRDAVVEKTGACNCIKISGAELYGFNTDVIGFERSLLNRLQPYHLKALILGTGGAAKAAQFVLNKLGIENKLVSRFPSPGQLSYAQLDAKMITEHLLIIQATPLGTYPEIDQAPALAYDALTTQHFLFDMVYNPEETLFLKRGFEKNTTIQNGYEMLIYQAEENWKIWND